ncbi:Uncharacterised protein [Mycobacterium tuberculosis]|nr:Uncharacterised protein [Mycobacterium tuberculosis]COY66656.1 Uncharacterised protein [Mycobacterium tuberculosis]
MICGSYRSGLSTPVLRLSHTSRAGTPSKNSNAATWQAHQAVWSIRMTGRTNRCRENASTITNAHTATRRAVAGSNHMPSRP